MFLDTEVPVNYTLLFSWDIMARFGPAHPDLPPAFFSDFTKMAFDESKHL